MTERPAPLLQYATGQAWETRTNRHNTVTLRDGSLRLACVPNKPLPKGEPVPTGPSWVKVDGQDVRTNLPGIICNRCNDSNPFGR